MAFAGSRRRRDDGQAEDSSPAPLSAVVRSDSERDYGRLISHRRPAYAVVRALTFWIALLCAGVTAWRSLVSPANLGALVIMTCLLLLLQVVPISWTRERPLTFVA